MGDRDYRSGIQNSVESVGRELEYRFNKEDITKIHASEVTGCLRRAILIEQMKLLKCFLEKN